MFSLIKKFTTLALIFYFILTIRSIIKRNVFKFNLKTGDRKNTASNFFAYLDFCKNNLASKVIHHGTFDTALEVGPGDNHAISLLLKECGVKKIYTVDKFQMSYDDELNYPLYSDISRYFNIHDWKNKVKSIIRFTSSMGISDLIDIKDRKFDLIYSVSVVEHLWPWEKYVSHMSELLESKGLMVHIVNFTDHSMLSPEGNRFRFRTIPSFIYDTIMRPVGRPNRLLPSQFIKFLEKKGLAVEVDVIRTHTKVLEAGEKYNFASIPKAELSELFSTFPSLKDANPNVILDMCIGSATFTISKNDKSISD